MRYALFDFSSRTSSHQCWQRRIEDGLCLQGVVWNWIGWKCCRRMHVYAHIQLSWLRAVSTSFSNIGQRSSPPHVHIFVNSNTLIFDSLPCYVQVVSIPKEHRAKHGIWAPSRSARKLPARHTNLQRSTRCIPPTPQSWHLLIHRLPMVFEL